MRDYIRIPATMLAELYEDGVCKDDVKMRELIKIAQLPRLHIAGTRWFNEGDGNTYHKVRIYANDEKIGEIGDAYGYGDQFLTTAFDWLTTHEPDLIPGYERGKVNITIYLREVIQGTYSVQDVARRKDF